MHRAAWNPPRRNKNIGTSRQGHGQNNRLVIPEPKPTQKFYYEKLKSPIQFSRWIGGREQVFFVEPTRPGWFYPCTVDDIVRVLEQCDPTDLACIDFIVLRQPTKKQWVLNPVWGRALFYYELGKHHGSAIVIDAQSPGRFVWPKSLAPHDLKELNRLRAEGHVVRTSKRRIEFLTSPWSLRNTVLYRTLLHEMGHHHDYQRSPHGSWGSKTVFDKEAYAHRYAEECYAKLSARGVLPFDPIIDPESFARDKLQAHWFIPQSAVPDAPPGDIS